ncbi:M13 family metallopeptidase [Novosphingobium piscinae]|uniref:M13 family metallopeptidase n=1 Tax=Novosphingobium piscinae TaxID=1507448 RepID=A0A7X1KQZ8_9SPHN|nr:M13 family metallopeptidase [Novosphingobium piscinae]MBC2670244.1 M13 family metallopeptidase [Novosphingobium piscinae]
MNKPFLLAASSLALVLTASGPALAQTAPATSAAPAATADTGDWGRAGLQTQWIDRSVRPGQDFFRYVNGKWIDQFEIPADRTGWGSFHQLAALSETRVRAIIDDLVASKPAPGSNEARLLAAYSAFMNEGAIEQAGLAPARPVLDRIAAARSADDLLVLFAAPGLPSPINGSVDADPKQSDRYVLQLDLGGLGLPDRDYYLSDNPRFPPIRAQYKAFTAMLLGEAGIADPQGMAERIYALETELARAAWDRTITRDPDLTYNKLTMAEVAALPGGADLATFIRASGPGAAAASVVTISELPLTPAEVAQARLTPDELKAKVGGGFPAALALIRSQPVEVWKAWLAARFLSAHASVLPRRIDDANFAFYGKLLSGQPEQRARWKRGLDAVQRQLGDLLGQIYVARYFPAANRAAMTDLVGNLRKAMAANLAELKWMGPETRKQAEAKLAAFTPKIGSTDQWKDYAGLTITATTAFANDMAAAEWHSAFADKRIGQPIDRSEWYMQPQTVNAYYSPQRNEIVFPAAILQPPFFNLSADPAVNYGGIGAVIGHEMGHGFDDQGAKFDGTGNLRDWWTAADKRNFVALTDRLVGQYDKLCPFDGGKTCVNGKLTLGENIGDLGGLSLAYRAYKLSLGGKPAPVIDGLTGDQRFFMGFAQVWRSKYREETARQLLLVDPHSPAMYRVNGIVRNFDEWYKAFGVKPGDALYLPPAERIRIW